jgi:hypothetical protein
MLYKDGDHQTHLDDLCLDRLNKQCRTLSSKTTCSSLTKKDADSLMNFSPCNILKEWEEKAPLFVEYVIDILTSNIILYCTFK